MKVYFQDYVKEFYSGNFNKDGDVRSIDTKEETLNWFIEASKANVHEKEGMHFFIEHIDSRHDRMTYWY